MVDLSVIRDLVAIFGVLAGFTYYVLNVRATRKNQNQQLETRQAQLYMDTYRTSYDPAYMKAVRTIHLSDWKTADDFFKEFNYYDKDVPDNEVMTSVYFLMSFYEGVGVLVREGLLDIKYVALTMAGTTTLVWRKFVPIIDEIREVMGARSFDMTEYLYNELIKYMDEHPELAV